MTNVIEQTKRALYDCLDRIKRAAKHRVLTAEFEERLEEHLEELRKEAAACQARIGELYSSRQQWKDIAADRLDKLSSMTEERDQMQQRLHAVDHAHYNLDQANKVVGEELRKAQEQASQDRDDTIRAVKVADAMLEKVRQFESGELYQKLQRELRDTRQDVKNAEAFSEGLYNELVDAKELIVRQREKIGELFMEREGKQAISPGRRNFAKHMGHVLDRCNAQT
jgi:replicative superfamily II helicase